MAYVMKEINSASDWDGFVKRYSPMALFQSWTWGDVAKKNHQVWRFGWFEADELVAVAQVQKVHARRGTFLHVRHGPILKNQNISVWKKVLGDLKELAKGEKAWFFRVSPLLEISDKHTQLYKVLRLRSAPIHAMDAELCWVLELDKSEDEILMGMRKTTRYEIKRAQKMGVTITKDAKLDDFFALYKETSDRHKFVRHTGISEEVEVFGTDVGIFNGMFEGKILASAIILFWGDQAIYHHGASIPSKVPVSYLVQWEAIREAKKRGKKLYNFWGIAPEDNPKHPWRGITLFKTGFGGRQMAFMHAADLPVSPLYVIPKTIEQIRKKIKGY
jgi:lipid II:glycine glycyltransferase (peptidoglycan interpeptide bridge formation enzyme)